MKTTSIISLILVTLCFSLRAEIEESKNYIYFETDRAELGQESRELLDLLLERSKAVSDFEITVIGHTDSRGTLNYNQQLSARRTASVKQYLIDRGMGEIYISTAYKGELEPAKPNTNPDNMEVNRRVEVIFTTYSFNNIEELQSALEPKKEQHYQIDPAAAQVLQGKKGVKILFPQHAFVDSCGEIVKEEVEVELVEALNYSEFIASGLQTRSGDRLLESGGMIKLTARSKSGEELNLAENKALTVAIPNPIQKKGMEVFISNSAGSDWQTTGRQVNSRNFNMPAYPSLEVDKKPMPKFRYDIEAPKAPRKPRTPRMPHRPRVESFYRPVPWYSLRKNKIKEGQRRRYVKAMERYEKRMSLFEERNQPYLKKMELFEAKTAVYKQSLADWHAAKDSAYRNFEKSEVFQAALARKQASNQKYEEQYLAEVEKWHAEYQLIKEKWGNDMDKLGIDEAAQVENYVFTVANMEWINCDRFRDVDPYERQDILVSTNDLENEKVLILFKRIKSMIACRINLSDSSFVAEALPKNEPKYLFAFKIVDSKPQICFRPMDGSKQYQLNYRESSFVEIKEILKQFNRT